MININFLKYFHDVAISGSVSAAAKLNFVSQPAISQGIKKLEESLDFSLMLHKRNNISLTAEGQVVFENAKLVFAGIKDFEDKLSYINENVVGKIRIGTSHTLGKKFLPSFLKSFTSKYPDVDVQIILGKTNDLKRLIENKEIDFALTIDNGELGSLKLYNIYNGQFVLYGKKRNDNKLLITETRPEVMALENSSFYKNQLLNVDRMIIESWEIIFEFCESALGIGLIPDFMIPDKRRILSKIYPYKIVLATSEKRNSKIYNIFLERALNEMI